MKSKMTEIMPGVFLDIEGIRALAWLPDDLFAEAIGLGNIDISPEEVRKVIDFFLWCADNQSELPQ